MVKGTLYVVATPIGNLRDITQRALDVLRGVDVVAAEDTRNTRHLLQHYGISSKLIALHEHNEAIMAQRVVADLQAGLSIALVSDAGTPAVSDPGALLVAKVREAGQRVEPLPGANAAIAALSASGSACPHFLFYGFLQAKSGARRRELELLKTLPYTLVFYEAPHRIVESLEDLQQVFQGERGVTIAREITKAFESIERRRVDEAVAWVQADPNRRKGEFVLVVEPPPVVPDDAFPEAAVHVLETLLRELPLKQAVKLAAEISGAKKNELYRIALQLKGEQD